MAKKLKAGPCLARSWIKNIATKPIEDHVFDCGSIQFLLTSLSPYPFSPGRLSILKGGESLRQAATAFFAADNEFATCETAPYPMSKQGNKFKKREPSRRQIFFAGFVYGVVFCILWYVVAVLFLGKGGL